MALQTFNFPFHKVSLRYPERSATARLGGGWDHVTKPLAPISKILTLHFQTMKFFEEGESLTSLQMQYSAGHLEDFYIAHEQHREFIYNHPRHGNLLVRFQKPLEIPKGHTGADGAIEPFQISLKELPYG